MKMRIGKSELIKYFERLQKSKNKDDRIKVNKIRMYMKLLEEYGLQLNEPYIKKITKDIWELRPLRDRFLFAYWKEERFIILSHFLKQTQKTPKKEIEKAEKILIDFLDRGDEFE